MRQGASGRRTRGRSGGRKHVPLKMQNFDSNGPDVRVRGNANQVYEKYLALARDANAAGDRVMAESYHQHAEHYYRIINETTDPQSEEFARGEQQDDAGDGWGRAEPQHRQGGRGSRQERRERYERNERAATPEQGRDASPGSPAGDGMDKGADHRRPDGYGRIAGGGADGAGNDSAGAAADGVRPHGGAPDGGETPASEDGPSQSPTKAQGDASGDEPSTGDGKKPRRGRGRPRKTAGPRRANGEAGDASDGKGAKGAKGGGVEADAPPTEPGQGQGSGTGGDSGNGSDGGDSGDQNGALAG